MRRGEGYSDVYKAEPGIQWAHGPMPSPFFSLKSNLHLWGLPRGETGICEATLGLRNSGKKKRFDLTDEDAKGDNVRHNTKMACHVHLFQTPTIFWRIHKQQDSQLSLCDGCFHPACDSLEKWFHLPPVLRKWQQGWGLDGRGAVQTQSLSLSS